MKTCNKCNESKSEDLFAMKGGKPRGVCKECHSAYQKAYYADPENGRRHRARVAKNNARLRYESYGLTVEEAVEFRKRNSGLCELCNRKVATCIDHDHSSGRARGHLCSGCNTALGLLGDSIEGLEVALRYLKNPPASSN